MPNFRITQQHAIVEADTELFNAVWRIVDPTNVSHDGHGIYSYIGEGGSSEKDIASIRTLLPLDPTKKEGLSSFQITLLDTGARNYIAVGVCDPAYPSHLLPGWEETSVAFHTDNGSAFHSSDNAIPLNKRCKNGDIIKVSISTNPQDPATVIVDFYCNDITVYQVATALPEGGFHGVIGLMSLGEKIKISEPMITKKVEFKELWEVSTPHAVTHMGWGMCLYSGMGDYKETSIGTIRSKSPVDLLGEFTNRVLEVRIIDPGEARYIAIGVVDKSYPTNLFPGWKEPSIGYHADNGNLFCGAEQSTNRPCKAGDLMKCVLEPIDKSSKRSKITFYRNLVEVGQVTAWTPQGGFFLCVGMMSRSEKVDITLPEIVIPYKVPSPVGTLCYEDYWEEITSNLVHEGEGVYQYVGQGGQNFVGSIRSKRPLDPLGSGNWFEVKIVNPGLNCYIALGVCSNLYSPDKLLGWEELSVGFHADNGLILVSKQEEYQTSHPCNGGDVIRCTIVPVDGSDKQVKVLFHRNGDPVGDVIFWSPSKGCYAQIGCMSVGEMIRVYSPAMEASLHTSEQATLPQSQSVPSMFQTAQGPPSGALPHRHDDIPPGHSHHFSVGTQPPHDPHSFHPFYPHPMHQQFPPPPHLPQGGGFHPTHGVHGRFTHGQHPSFSRHPHQRIWPVPHPHRFGMGQMVNPQSRFHVPAFRDLNASFPPVAPSPTQPQRQLSEQPLRVTRPAAKPPQRLNTHPLDHPSTREGVFSPVQDTPVGFPSSLEPARNQQDHTENELNVQDRHLPQTAAALKTASDEQLLAGTMKGYPVKRLVDKSPEPMESEFIPTESVPPESVPPESVFVPVDDDVIASELSKDAERKLFLEPRVSRPTQPLAVSSSSQGGVTHKQHPLSEGDDVDHIDTSHHTRTLPLHTVPVGETSEQLPLVPTEATPPEYPVDEPVDPPSKPGKVRPPIVSQLSVASLARVIPKEENKHFKILHNVNSTANDGVFENSLPEDEMLDNAFIVSRLPLTEKNPYFEVEIQHVGPNSNITVGLVWDNYPVFYLPGALEGSIAFHSLTGSVQNGGGEVESSQAAASCIQGDVIGCRAMLSYKSEVSDNSQQVEFYYNGCLLCVEEVVLPPSGFFPAIGFKGHKSKVKFSRGIQLSPETYFETHPIPRDYCNFSAPPPLVSGWQCVRNSEIKSDVKLHMIKNRSTPAVVQNHAPLSKTSPYFEIQLQYLIKNYSVLSIGVTPKTISDTKKVIPGEGEGSVGFLPLLGFIMKSSSISCTIPGTVLSNLSSQRVTLGVGIDFYSQPTELDVSLKSDKLDSSINCLQRVRVFFTVNRQEVSSIYSTLLDDGLYPCLAIDSDSIQVVNCLASVHFPAQWPPYSGELPLGFVRGPQPAMKLYDVATFVDERLATSSSTSLVRAIQAATPLSPAKPYYEICIIGGGDSFKISCGLASFNYPLNIHPGWNKDSIALHADDGNLFKDGNKKLVCPPSHYRGTIMGCGLRFPEAAPKKYAEAFFTLNRKLVAKQLVKVPLLGFFPTIGVRTQGAIVSTDLCALDPFPEMAFSTSWAEIRNMKVEGNIVQPLSQSEPAAAIRDSPLKTHEVSYFSVTPLLEREGRIIIGFSTSKICPLNLLHSNVEDLKAYAVDVTMGVVMMYDHYFQTKEAIGAQKGKKFGCGLLSQPSINKLLFFFVVDDQAISFTAIDEISEDVYPFVMLIDSPTQVLVNMCALWPPTGPVGRGWARHANVKLKETKLTHSALPGKTKFPVGFLQSSTPLTHFSPYFEIEICSRATDKAIAIGLASRRYPMNSWVGWSNESIAYHLDDGKLFRVSSCGHNFGPKAFAGDIVGCGVRFGTSGLASGMKGDEKVEVFFTINGGIIGTQKVTIPAGGMFPTICLESPSESVVVSRHDQYPPLQSMVCDKEWACAYCVAQSGMFLHNSCRNTSPVISKGFCQAKNPFAPSNCYFETLVTGSKEPSQIQVGLSTLIPHGTTSPNTYSIVYSAQGQIITRRANHRGGTQKYTSHAQKAGIGDRLGCYVVFSESTPTAVEFFLNQMKVISVNITDFWAPQNVYPTIILPNPGDSVMPFLNIFQPKWDPHSLAGWLRSERVKLRNRIIEYSGQGKTYRDVGVAQISHTLQVNKNSYFEVEILDPGEKCTIGIGVAPADYPLERHPGWEKESIAYHGDDGHLFQENGSGCPFGPTLKKNDVVGVGVRSAVTDSSSSSESEVQVYFTRNGEEIGHTTHRVPPSGLFPTVGLHSPGEKVKIFMSDSSRAPCNIEPRRAMWRSLCGIHVTGESTEGPHVLTFRKCGRKGLKLTVLTSIAISAQPFSNSMQYFEVDLIKAGPFGIAVGVAPMGYPLDQATGWMPGSVAYHTDDGCLYMGSARGTVFGPVSHRGDVIGCGVTFSSSSSKNCSVFFTYNGCEIGRERAKYVEGGLFPSITLTSHVDKVAVRLMETFKSSRPQSMDLFVGLMRINNCSYSDQLVRFTGAGNSGYTNAPAMAQFAVPLHHKRNFFSANIVKSSDVILIGLAVKDYPFKYVPGTASVSIAYNVTDGKVKAVYGSEDHYGMEVPGCRVGDTIGCGIDHSGSKEESEHVFFTKNGKLVSRVKLAEMVDDLFPVVGFVAGLKNSVVFMDWSAPLYQPLNSF